MKHGKTISALTLAAAFAAAVPAAADESAKPGWITAADDCMTDYIVARSAEMRDSGDTTLTLAREELARAVSDCEEKTGAPSGLFGTMTGMTIRVEP